MAERVTGTLARYFPGIEIVKHPIVKEYIKDLAIGGAAMGLAHIAFRRYPMAQLVADSAISLFYIFDSIRRSGEVEKRVGELLAGTTLTAATVAEAIAMRQKLKESIKATIARLRGQSQEKTEEVVSPESVQIIEIPVGETGQSGSVGEVSIEVLPAESSPCQACVESASASEEKKEERRGSGSILI